SVLGDLRQCLAVLELGAQLCFGQPEIGGGSVGSADEEVVLETAVRASAQTEEREVARLDPRLDGLAIGLRQAAGGDRCVDAVLQGLLECVRERARRDTEL